MQLIPDILLGTRVSGCGRRTWKLSANRHPRGHRHNCPIQVFLCCKACLIQKARLVWAFLFQMICSSEQTLVSFDTYQVANMAYVIDPHHAFHDRVSRLLRKRHVPLKQCRLNDAWLSFVAATQAYLLWPEHRTAYRYQFTHEDGVSGPVTVIKWTVYYEHVNRQNRRTAVSYSELVLELPLVIPWRGHEATIGSSQYGCLTDWLKAVQHDPILVYVAKTDKRWNRRLSSDFIATE